MLLMRKYLCLLGTCPELSVCVHGVSGICSFGWITEALNFLGDKGGKRLQEHAEIKPRKEEETIKWISNQVKQDLKDNYIKVHYQSRERNIEPYKGPNITQSSLNVYEDFIVSHSPKAPQNSTQPDSPNKPLAFSPWEDETECNYWWVWVVC